MDEGRIIGVDHGYAAMKTANFIFPTGLAAYDYAPYTLKDTLEYDGKYYVIGNERQRLQRDKTLTDDSYLMTLAAIAKEIELRNLDRVLDVHLAAGLPLTGFGREQKAFERYLLRDGQPAQFRFEGLDYLVTIKKVTLFPQGYAALSIQEGLSKEPSVIVADIGGWTVDMMRVDNQHPNEASSRSEEEGLIRCMDNIAEAVRRKLGVSVNEAQIGSVLRGEASSIPDSVRKIIDAEAERHVRRLLSLMMEAGMDYHLTPLVVFGGGSLLVKRYLPSNASIFRVAILDDVRLNAKAYERIAAEVIRRRRALCLKSGESS